jgi:flagellar basal-body rod protein FlgF
LSSKGIYSALSGALAQNQRLDTIANNLANVNTTGFKKDQQTFREYVTANEKFPDVIQAPRVPASIESFYDMQGGDRAYAESNGTFSDFAQGALKPTGGTLDFAIEGDGFFEVMTPGGPRLTRNGGFKMDASNRLINSEGYPVLKEGQGDPAQRGIQLTGRNVTVSYGGEIWDGEQSLGKLSVVTVDKKEALQKFGNSIYGLKENFAQIPKPANDFRIHQGNLEMSNVNVVEEMTEMIKTTRMFEATQNAIKTFDSLDDKLSNVVGKAP